MAPKGESRQNLIEMLQKKASQFKAFASDKQTGWGKAKEDKAAKASAKHIPARQIFGVDIAEALSASNEMLKCDECIPRLVYRCIEYIESKAFDEVGIYRLSGGIQSIRETRESFAATGDCNMNEKFLDPNSAASLLKAFVREFPEVILTNELFPQFQQIFQGHESIDIDNSVMLDGNHPVLLDPDLYQQTLNIVQKLPVANYDFLRALLSHLKRISQNYEVNKMGINNLSLVWRPTIQFGGTLFVFLTFHSDTIFSGRERQHNLILPARGSSLKNHSELVTPIDSTFDSSADQENKDDILDNNVFGDKYACEPVVAAERLPDLKAEIGPFQEAQDSLGLMDDSMTAPAKPSRSKQTFTDFEIKLETEDQNNDDGSILLDLIADATTPVQPNTPAEGNPEKSTVDVKTIQNNQYVNKGSLQHLNVSTQSLLVAKHADRGSQNLKRSEQAIAQPDVLDDDYKHSSSKLSSKNANENTRKSYGYESSQPDSPHSSRSMSPEQFNDDAEIDGPLPPMLKPRRVRH